MKMGILFVTEGKFVAVVGTRGFLWLAMIMITSLQVAFSILKLSFAYVHHFSPVLPSLGYQ